MMGPKCASGTSMVRPQRKQMAPSVRVSGGELRKGLSQRMDRVKGKQQSRAKHQGLSPAEGSSIPRSRGGDRFPSLERAAVVAAGEGCPTEAVACVR